MSYKGGHGGTVESLEGKNCSRCGSFRCSWCNRIARTFAYGGAKGRLMYDPTIPPREEMTKEEYRKNNDPSLNHFYEKL